MLIGYARCSTDSWDLAAPDTPAAPRPLRLTSRTRQADWRRANPARYAVHLAVRPALASGRLARQGCKVCGSPAVDAHHACYAAPLDVRWLCRCHHVRLHRGGEDLFATGSKRADAEGKEAGHVGLMTNPIKVMGGPKFPEGSCVDHSLKSCGL